MTLCLHDLALAGTLGGLTRGLMAEQSTDCSVSRTEDIGFPGTNGTWQTHTSFQLPTALSVNLLLFDPGLGRAIWKLSVRRLPT